MLLRKYIKQNSANSLPPDFQDTYLVLPGSQIQFFGDLISNEFYNKRVDNICRKASINHIYIKVKACQKRLSGSLGNNRNFKIRQ